MFKSKETKMKEYWDKISHDEREKEKLWYMYQTYQNTKKSTFYLNAIGIILLICVMLSVFSAII
jgi:hypothetical protein